MSQLITIITATFNAAEHLPALADSIRAQTSKDFYWIIADGGSNDETLSIIQEHKDIVSLLLEGPDFGIYDALNKAVAKVTTPYYLVVGADDLLNQNAIELYTKAINISHADIISANVASSAFGILRAGRGQRWRFGHLAYVSQHSIGSLIKTSIHQKVGLYSKYYPIAADRYFLLNAIENHQCVVHGADFVAGFYSCQGLSSARPYDTLLDIFKVDYALSKHPVRTSIFSLLKYVLNIRKF
jgi:glycosyltransferase involved in cell wall biosynthesis